MVDAFYHKWFVPHYSTPTFTLNSTPYAPYFVLRKPYAALHTYIPHSAFRTPHSVVRTPYRARHVSRCIFVIALAAWLFLIALASAQTPPEIGYVFPPGGAPGSTVDVRIGGYNWTPDMQLFAHDPRVKLEVTGLPSDVLVPEPPYWFGKKARDNDFPLPREFPARLSIAADAPPGLVCWQAANANGATATGILLIWSGPVQTEPQTRIDPAAISTLPMTVIGQIQKLEEVDRFSLTALRSGCISLDLWTRRLGSQMNAIVEVRDASGHVVIDSADTAGHDLQLTFGARAGERYTISLYDADFRGHHSFVYRLVIHDGPRIVAALPAAGRRGDNRPVEFVGFGVATGTPQLESVTRDVQFPSNPLLTTFEYQLDTAFGKSLPFPFQLSELPESTESVSPSQAQMVLTVPAAVTGTLDIVRSDDCYEIAGTKGDLWRLTCGSAKVDLPLDPAVSILDATGKELVRGDDSPASTDCDLLFTVPADGSYRIVVSDQSGQSGNRCAVYRLTVESPPHDFKLTIPDKLALPLNSKAKLVVKGNRYGGLAAPISLEFIGLPPGVSVPSPLVILADKSELAVELTCSVDVAATATMVRVKGTAMVEEKGISRPSEPMVLAVVMKPRVKVTPEGLDDVRKWPRGSTYLAPVLVERLEGFTGEVLLEQTAHQQRVRQGITGPDFIVAPGITRVEYPVFLPEWLETTKTSRIILNGVTKVPDLHGNVRHLLNKMEMRVGMLPVGALLKVAHDADDLHVLANQPFEIPVHLTRSAELTEPATVELMLSNDQAKRVSTTPVIAQSAESRVVLRVTPVGGSFPIGEMTLTIRATALRGGKWPVISETTAIVVIGEGT